MIVNVVTKMQKHLQNVLANNKHFGRVLSTTHCENQYVHQINGAKIPQTIVFHDKFVNEDKSKIIWRELTHLKASEHFICNDQLKRSIFNARGKQLDALASKYFPTLFECVSELEPLFMNRSMSSTMRPNTFQINHYEHITRSGCPLHVDARGLGHSIGMLSFGNEATISFLKDPPPHFTQDQVEACEDELRLVLPDGSFLLFADDARYNYVHGIRSHIQRTSSDHSQRFSVVFWFQE